MARPTRSLRASRAIVGAVVALALAGFAALLGASSFSESPRDAPPPAPDATRGSASATILDGVVVGVVDGDTIRVRLGDRVEKVRYIGVDTPEIRHPRKGAEAGGRDSREVNRELVDGKRVRLELDVQERDRHGRLLAYVWVGDVMVNAELVRLGYAQVMTVPPNVRHQHVFLAREREARQAGRGLWRGA